MTTTFCLILDTVRRIRRENVENYMILDNNFIIRSVLNSIDKLFLSHSIYIKWCLNSDVDDVHTVLSTTNCQLIQLSKTSYNWLNTCMHRGTIMLFLVPYKDSSSLRYKITFWLSGFKCIRSQSRYEDVSQYYCNGITEWLY